jgi:methylglyoxal synthase
MNQTQQEMKWSSKAGLHRNLNWATAGRQFLISPRHIIPDRKRIALIAHDSQKERMGNWALKQKARLIEHELYATNHTADLITASLQVPVFRFLSGPLGGDQQIGSRIAESGIDILIFFWDPLKPQPHDCDVKALLRLAAVYNIPNAGNEATADCIVGSLYVDSTAVPT